MSQQFLYSLLTLVCFIPAMVLHELAHGWVAHKLGDPTAKRAGRLTLNPLKHIDPFGTVILPLGLLFLGGPVFGYAKPVPYNPAYFKNLRRGELMVGLAGPAANLLQALAAALLGNFFCIVAAPFWAQELMYVYAYINLILLFFNIIPIPPLDGSSVLAVFLPRRALPYYYKVERYALPILMVLMFALPYVLSFNPVSIYLDATAGNLTGLLFPLL
ncbi:MAG: site-2 protease family protein [Coriobacteriales bacterium]|jgi:Zn-dependent protease|nr:site-2 protease family protein [Coriobacteriales bacterium]